MKEAVGWRDKYQARSKAYFFYVEHQLLDLSHQVSLEDSSCALVYQVVPQSHL